MLAVSLGRSEPVSVLLQRAADPTLRDEGIAAVMRDALLQDLIACEMAQPQATRQRDVSKLLNRNDTRWAAERTTQQQLYYLKHPEDVWCPHGYKKQFCQHPFCKERFKPLRTHLTEDGRAGICDHDGVQYDTCWQCRAEYLVVNPLGVKREHGHCVHHYRMRPHPPEPCPFGCTVGSHDGRLYNRQNAGRNTNYTQSTDHRKGPRPLGRPENEYVKLRNVIRSAHPPTPPGCQRLEPCKDGGPHRYVGIQLAVAIHISPSAPFGRYKMPSGYILCNYSAVMNRLGYI